MEGTLRRTNVRADYECRVDVFGLESEVHDPVVPVGRDVSVDIRRIVRCDVDVALAEERERTVSGTEPDRPEGCVATVGHPAAHYADLRGDPEPRCDVEHGSGVYEPHACLGFRHAELVHGGADVDVVSDWELDSDRSRILCGPLEFRSLSGGGDEREEDEKCGNHGILTVTG